LTNIKEKAIELNSTYGFNVIPMYYLHRNSGVKKVKMIDWQKYKAEMYDLSDWRDEYKALAIMTGSISNLSILDIDSEEALDTILDALGGTIGDLANYIVKTTKGYQLFYTYESNTSTSIGVRDKVDFLSGGVTFAVEPNEGYTLLKQGKPEAMPTELKELILDDANSYEPQSDTAKAFANAIRENSSLPFTNPLYPTIKKFVDSTRITNHKDLEKVFCTKDYAGKSLKDFAKEGQIHASMMYVLGIVAGSPTISEPLYIEFAHKWAEKIAKIDTADEREQRLISNRIKGGMKYFRFEADWEDKAEEATNPSYIASAINLTAWFDRGSGKYMIYDEPRDDLTVLPKVCFKDHMTRLHNIAHAEDKMKVSDLDVTTVDSKRTIYDPTERGRFYDTEDGLSVFNAFRRPPAIKYFQDAAKPSAGMPSYFTRLLDNVIPKRDEQDLWLHNLAYHLTYLQVPQTMTVITGAGGTGKGTLLNDVHELIYGDYHTTVSVQDITKQFRPLLKHKLSIFIDEGEEHTNSYNSPKLAKGLKELVGNSKVALEMKNVNNTQADIHCAKYTLATNAAVPFKFENGDRRTNVFRTKHNNITTLDWFTTHEDLMKHLSKELHSFLDYLKSIEVSASRSRQLIDNPERKAILEASVDKADVIAKAIVGLNADALHDIDPRLGDWFDHKFKVCNHATCSISDLRDNVGETHYTAVSKLLVNYGRVKKKIKDVRSFILNPDGKDKVFASLTKN